MARTNAHTDPVCPCGYCVAERVVLDGANRLYSTVEVAAKLGITTRRVQVLSQHRGVGRQVGRAFVFTAADVEAMRRRQPGRPPSAVN